MVNLSSKELVRRTLSLDPVPRTPFIPWLFTCAAKLEQVSIQTMLNSPNDLAKSIEHAQQLFGYDAVVSIFDSTIEAEACGCKLDWQGEDGAPEVVTPLLQFEEAIDQIDIPTIEKMGRFPVVMEATKRLNFTLGRTVAIAGVVTGPLTLSNKLTGEDIVQKLENNPDWAAKVLNIAGKIIAKVCRSYCEWQMDIIVIADELLARLKPALLNQMVPYLQPAWNITRFYMAHPVVLTGEQHNGGDIFILGADGVVAGSSGPPDADVQRRNSCRGLAIPRSILMGSREEISKAVITHLIHEPKERSFITTEWEVPYNTPVENLHELMQVLPQLSSR